MNKIYGRRNVAEFLKTDKKIIKAIIAKNISGNIIRHIKMTLSNRNIPVEILNFKEITKIAGDKKHQGILLITEEQKFFGIDSFLKENPDEKIILILDHIQDTNNLGSILRTAEWFGIKTVILPKDRAAQITPAVSRISCGAVHNLKIFTETNLASVIEKLKNYGYWIVGTSPFAETEISDFKIPDKIGLVLGNEQKGISKLIEQKCDFKVSIKRIGKVESLNVSVSTGIIIYLLTNSAVDRKLCPKLPMQKNVDVVNIESKPVVEQKLCPKLSMQKA